MPRWGRGVSIQRRLDELKVRKCLEDPKNMPLDLSCMIQHAFLNGTHKSWANEFPGISEGSIQYGQVWEITYHYNNCKVGCDGKCIEVAKGLVASHLKDISNGKPDLLYYYEQQVWERAFKLHAMHSPNRGTMTPPWVLSSPARDRCDCFTRALQQFDEEVARHRLEDLPPVTAEDLWYSQRYD